ncbi:DUF1206 domain-containing protein, partial [Xanthobacter autotrophicus]|uniref:DUF1206 domain-containing protein n=1 Tax=Xanthobacter autotrophicus TaxID=280 RepID=UPI0024A65545
MGEMTDRARNTAEQKGRQTQDSQWFDYAIRIGFIAYGVVHLMIAWLAIQLAFGDREGQANNQGAMHQLAQQPFGEIMLWVIVFGMASLVVWKLLDAAFGHNEEDEDLKKWGKKANAAGKAILYGFVGY